MDLSVVIPVYNEEGNLPNLHERLQKVVQELGVSVELIFVNDGSKDQSMAIIRALKAKDNNVQFINFSRNFGHQIAVSAGLAKSSGDAVVIIDSDLQDPPELIVDLYRKHKEGFEVVYAKRRSRNGESNVKRFISSLFYRLLKLITSHPIPVDTGDFRIIDRKVVDILNQMPEQNKYLRGQISWVGFRQTAVEFDRDERMSGTTGYTYRKMISLALDGITGFSNFPLRAVSISGFLVSGVAFLLMLYALYSKIIKQEVIQGWTSLMLSVLLLGGIQLISVGVIGEYISRINHNVRDRPLYIIEEDTFDEVAVTTNKKEKPSS